MSIWTKTTLTFSPGSKIVPRIILVPTKGEKCISSQIWDWETCVARRKDAPSARNHVRKIWWDKCRNARAALMTRHGQNKARAPFQTPPRNNDRKATKRLHYRRAAKERSVRCGPLVVINQCQKPFSPPPETHTLSAVLTAAAAAGASTWVEARRTCSRLGAISCQRVIKRMKHYLLRRVGYCGTLCGSSTLLYARFKERQMLE